MKKKSSRELGYYEPDIGSGTLILLVSISLFVIFIVICICSGW